MKICPLLPLLFSLLVLLGGCTNEKLLARLEADPQCSPIVNAKTGALMPCSVTSKEIYRAAGLMPAAIVAPLTSQKDGPSQNVISSNSASQANGSSAPISTVNTAPVECKPQMHQKTGVLMPCPAP
ncbi:hypothetical protein SAMN06295945_1054 [Polynucleobacter meluiroseus]|uniref:Lipoprotein n=1 Tax=Polynucleobacter meluiroseus TaxID=1938814 RepID=A0A240DZU5_9BURK|nr:hypothetical protein [Polynucleobacter meluiroseus]SNX28709.1 hypothetical protein SAMN06295945_1054 [Polynucleobacter meluiroseus]